MWISEQDVTDLRELSPVHDASGYPLCPYCEAALTRGTICISDDAGMTYGGYACEECRGALDLTSHPRLASYAEWTMDDVPDEYDYTSGK